MEVGALIADAVFPTPVGVFPIKGDLIGDQVSLPHARGGVSLPIDKFSTDDLSSPRPWGCFPRVRSRRCLSPVFPTPVGVFPVRPC